MYIFVVLSGSQEINSNNTPPKHLQRPKQNDSSNTKNVHVLHDVMTVIQDM